MITFLKRLLKVHRFEEMRTPLGVIATDLCQGEPVAFSRSGSVFDPIRASCAYPGLFEPVRHGNSLLVDGAIGMGIPSLLARQLGATHVIAVTLPAGAPANPPSNMMQVLCRSFQVLQSRCEADWRVHTDHEITPDVRGVDWNAFGCGGALVKAGEAAAYKSLPVIQGWLAGSGTRRMPVHRAA
jgi:NTE family protein